jgi:biotin operon repressor
VGKWGLNPAEAKALDGVTAYGSNELAAKMLGISRKTLENNLAKAYAHLQREGADLGDEPRAYRNLAVRLWILYWWSDEGKANLRNVRLTSQPEA